MYLYLYLYMGGGYSDLGAERELGSCMSDVCIYELSPSE